LGGGAVKPYEQPSNTFLYPKGYSQGAIKGC